AFPALGCLQTIFEIANAREVLVEPHPVAASNVALQVAHLVGDGIQNRTSRIEFCDPRFNLRWIALNEHLPEDARSALFRRNGDAAAGPRKRARATIHSEGQRGKARLVADALGDVLIERNRVAERTASRM